MESLEEPQFLEFSNIYEYDHEGDHFGKGDNRCERDEVKLQSFVPYTSCRMHGMNFHGVATHSLDNGRETRCTLSSYSQSTSKDDFMAGPWCENNAYREFSPPSYSFCSRECQRMSGRWTGKDHMRSALYTFSSSPSPTSHTFYPPSLCDDNTDIYERNTGYDAYSARLLDKQKFTSANPFTPLSSYTPYRPYAYHPSSNTIRHARKENDNWFLLFEVQFKRSSRLCIGSEDDFCIDIGDFVCVTGDRGIDIGKVVYRKVCYNLPPPSMPLVLNKATHNEIRLLKDQRREESQVVNLCREKASSHGLDMMVLDAEFQYDRKKLTIYYYSDVRIDFRGFVKELYSLFYARIWMENVKLTSQQSPTISASASASASSASTGIAFPSSSISS